MSDTKHYIQKLFAGSNIAVASNRNKMFEEYAAAEQTINTVNQIKSLQNSLMRNWKLETRIKDIQEQAVSIPNATVGKPYTTKFDFVKMGWNDIVFSAFENLDKYGLAYDSQTETIAGTPTQSGDFKIKLLFRVQGEAEESVLHEKWISFIINADPKSLWKDVASNEKDEYWKPDNVADFQPLGSKHIVVSSKRGRSHANVGSFRDDDFAFKYFAETGWSVVAVSDGAGSAKVSRKGSELSCKTVTAYFETNFTAAVSKEFDELMAVHQQETTQKATAEIPIKIETENTAPTGENVTEATTEISETAPIVVEEKAETNSSKISKFIYNHLGNAARTVHKTLEEFAVKKEIALKDLHSTLIFALYKKYDFGYVVLSFGVGDCPIGLLNKEMTELKLMNWLDVGEFGGGTRFITMPEIFSSDKFPTRFGFKLIEDFSYLILMTDGIYDPKFVVEANLEKVEKWQEFIADLEGNNKDKTKVELKISNKEIAGQLATWMDFWSAGNHDDRTLAIVF